MHILSNARPFLTSLLVLAGLSVMTGCASFKSGPQKVESSGTLEGQEIAQLPTEETDNTKYNYEEVLDKAEGFFGSGAKGIAKALEGVFKKYGKPNAYINGSEGGGAFVAGLRYGSGTLHHKVEGDSKIYWAGPSLGIDVGGDLNKCFTLIYHLYDTAEIYKRFPGVEGKAYFVAGLSVTYYRHKNIVIVPIRLGGGWRLGANVGFVKFSKKRIYNPL